MIVFDTGSRILMSPVVVFGRSVCVMHTSIFKGGGDK